METTMNQSALDGAKGEIVMYQPDETIRLEVRMEDETVWLTQQQMAELFSVKENTVTYHIQEIFNTEELIKEATARKIRVVRKEGNRLVKRWLDYYNLDMIISVGYKVNSKRGVKFRQWASGPLILFLRTKAYRFKSSFLNSVQKEIRNIKKPPKTGGLFIFLGQGRCGLTPTRKVPD